MARKHGKCLDDALVNVPVIGQLSTRLIVFVPCPTLNSVGAGQKKTGLKAKAVITPKEQALLNRVNHESMAKRTSNIMVLNQVNHNNVKKPTSARG